MENNAPMCPKCNGEMEPGFVPDYSHGLIKQNAWAPGPPQQSIWTGLKQPKQQFPIITFRCMRCGYLESYVWRNSTQ